MRAVDIIIKKPTGQTERGRDWILRQGPLREYTEYQVSAWLMAAFLKGWTSRSWPR